MKRLLVILLAAYTLSACSYFTVVRSPGSTSGNIRPTPATEGCPQGHIRPDNTCDL